MNWKVLGMVLWISLAARAEHSAPTQRIEIDPAAVPNYSPESAVVVTMEVRSKILRANPRSWRELEQALDTPLIPPGGESSLPPFDAAAVGSSLDQLSREILADPPRNWEELAQSITPFTDVLPAELVQNFIVQKVLEREEKLPSSTERAKPGESSDKGSPTSPDPAESNVREFSGGGDGATGGVTGSAASGFSFGSSFNRPFPEPTPLSQAEQRWRRQQAPKAERLLDLLSRRRPASPRRADASALQPVLDEPSQRKASSVPLSPDPAEVYSMPGELPPAAAPAASLAPTVPPALSPKAKPSAVLLQIADGLGPEKPSSSAGMPVSEGDFPFPTYSPPPVVRERRKRFNVTPAAGPGSAALPSEAADISPSASVLGASPDSRWIAARLLELLLRAGARKTEASRPARADSPETGILTAPRPVPEAFDQIGRVTPAARRLASLTGLSASDAELLYQRAKSVAWMGTFAWLVAVARTVLRKNPLV